MSETPTASPYMTTKELAALTGKTAEAIRTARRRGAAPQGKRFGRSVLSLRDDVQAWLEGLRETDPLTFYRPEVQAWLAEKRRADRRNQPAASAA